MDRLGHYALRNKKTVRSENPIPRHGDFHHKKSARKGLYEETMINNFASELIKSTTLIENGISENEKSIL